MKRALRIVLLLVLLLAVWTVGIEPRWVAARRIEYRVPGWQRPPLKVAVASDRHISNHAFWRVMTRERAAHIVDAINILPVRFWRRPEWVLFVLDAAVG